RSDKRSAMGDLNGDSSNSQKVSPALNRMTERTRHRTSERCEQHGLEHARGSSQFSGDVVDQPFLRIGVLIDSPIQPRWVRRVLEEIQSSAIAKVVLVVRLMAGSRSWRSRWMTLMKERRHWLSWLYLKLDERFFRPANNAFELVGI